MQIQTSCPTRNPSETDFAFAFFHSFFFRMSLYVFLGVLGDTSTVSFSFSVSRSRMYTDLVRLWGSSRERADHLTSLDGSRSVILRSGQEHRCQFTFNTRSHALFPATNFNADQSCMTVVWAGPVGK
ncbi:hypothetical protein OG21DRAFT_922504 [Imleria badia]|nr:hypothetical protein OG21DRAFT_922504 [Imleria badia]